MKRVTGQLWYERYDLSRSFSQALSVAVITSWNAPDTDTRDKANDMDKYCSLKSYPTEEGR